LIECLGISDRRNSLVTGLISRGDNRDRADSDPGTLSLFLSPFFGLSVSTSPPRRRCFTQRVCSRDVTQSNGIHPTSSTHSSRVCVHSFVFFALTSSRDNTSVTRVRAQSFVISRRVMRIRHGAEQSCQNSFYLTGHTSNFAQFYTGYVFSTFTDWRLESGFISEFRERSENRQLAITFKAAVNLKSNLKIF